MHGWIVLCNLFTVFIAIGKNIMQNGAIKIKIQKGQICCPEILPSISPEPGREPIDVSGNI